MNNIEVQMPFGPVGTDGDLTAIAVIAFGEIGLTDARARFYAEREPSIEWTRDTGFIRMEVTDYLRGLDAWFMLELLRDIAEAIAEERDSTRRSGELNAELRRHLSGRQEDFVRRNGLESDGGLEEIACGLAADGYIPQGFRILLGDRCEAHRLFGLATVNRETLAKGPDAVAIKVVDLMTRNTSARNPDTEASEE